MLTRILYSLGLLHSKIIDIISIAKYSCMTIFFVIFIKSQTATEWEIKLISRQKIAIWLCYYLMQIRSALLMTKIKIFEALMQVLKISNWYVDI